MSNNIPVLMLRDENGKFFPVDGITGSGGGSTGTELFVVNVQSEYGEYGEYEEGFIITSHDKTYAQIDEAYKAGKQVLVACTIIDWDAVCLIPLVIAAEDIYEFSVHVESVFVVSVDNTDMWNFYMGAFNQSRTYNNESILDNLSNSNGVLKYNNDPIIPQKIYEGSNITLADNTEYRLTDVSTLNLTYPTGDFECWMRLTFAASGDIAVTLPTDTKYIGTAPDFKNGETWELRFKDKVLAAQKVGDGA